MRYPCVLGIPLTFLPIFLGKACLNTQIRWLNPEFNDRMVKFWIQAFFCRIRSRIYWYRFAYLDSIYAVWDIVVAYVTLWYPFVSDTPLTLWPIFLGKACLDTWIGQLNPECYDKHRKNIDSTVQFTPITAWNGPFCWIQKSHTQSRMWNHARTFTFSIFVGFA